MPTYEYEHTDAPCEKGRIVEIRQSLAETPFTRCPHCGGNIRKIMSLNFINTPKSDSDLRNLGFTKLVKRDDGVYENVTRRGGDSRYMLRDRPETIPNLSKTISD